MVRAIIFDCFGVLTTDGWLAFKARHFNHDPILLEQAISLNKQCDAGLISYDDFVAGVARLANVTPARARAVINNNVANEPLFHYIAGLKASYKLGILSNAGANWLDELFQPDQVALFDAIALSYETGHVKPDSRAYQDITERLALRPDECLFIDDQERYCVGAREAGMSAIWYRDFDQMKAELEAILADLKD